MQENVEAVEETEDDELKKLNKKLDGMYSEAKKYRDTLDPEIDEYERFYHKKHWPTGTKKPVENIVFQVVETEVPILSDSMPGTEVISRDEDKEDAARQLQAHLNYTYEWNAIVLKIPQVIRKLLIGGTSFLYVSYDADADGGYGMARIEICPRKMILIDPLCNEIDDAGYFIRRKPTRVGEARKEFAKFKDDIKEQSINLELGGKANDSASEDKNTYSIGGDTQKEDKYALDGLCFVDEFWFKDYTMVPVSNDETAAQIAEEEMQFLKGEIAEVHKFEDHQLHIQQHLTDINEFIAQIYQIAPEQVSKEVLDQFQQDEAITQPVKNQIQFMLDHVEIHAQYLEQGVPAEKPLYPEFWRKVIRIGKVIVEDNTPFLPAGIVPLIPFYCYKDDESNMGFGEVKNIIDCQKVLNEMDYALELAVRLTSNPIVVMDENCGIKTGDVDNRPGKKYVKKQGTEFKIQVPPPVGEDYRRLKQDKREAIRDISGINEATTGQSPGSNSSGRMVRLLQEQSIGRIRLKSRMLEAYSMVRLGKVTAAYIAKYGVARKIRNKDESGNYVYVDYNPGAVEDLKYEVLTVPGTTAGPDRETMQSELQAALDGGHIAYEDFLKALNPPYKRTILASIRQRMEAESGVRNLEQENLTLRAQFKPETLSKEEIEIVKQIQMQSQGVA